jgi:AbrB family looped-hinge helix DNA binding protein
MSKTPENKHMALMRVRRLAQLTLPAEVRRALNVQEGDYLEAEIVKGGVLLKPVSVVKRKQAWQRIEEITSRVHDRKPDSRKSNTEEEEEIAESVKEFRRKNTKRV